MQDVLYATVFMGVVFGLAALILALRDRLTQKPDITAEKRVAISPANDPVLSLVQGLLPSVDMHPDQWQDPIDAEDSYHMELPVPDGADYQFVLWLGCGEKQISARLLAQTEHAYFWYMPFEEVTFRSAEELNKEFIKVVDQIIRHHTRIEQMRGLLANHFKCEFKSANGWETVYRHSGLRWIGAPQILGRTRIYQSPPLIADS